MPSSPVYAALNLLGMYHDSILVRLLSPPKVPSALGKPLPSPALQGSTAAGLAPAPPATYTHHQHTPSSHARYTHHFSDSSPSYRVVARTLVIIGYLELLAEMVARRKLGRKEAWNVVAGIEGAK